ncbi:hypothetical protein [Spiroplasma endosymbiont of Andrena trimmerana]|uniref:hypothetical protein n=1 Tax=Spiroplasma endosymbiont of Andrena trimmerana TaxID=3066316 RepID=UPI0030CC3F63
MQENFYIKKIYYGAYVKNIILPMSAILNNKRNEIGVKNLGINDKKLRNNAIRTKTKLIHKAYHNFYNSKVLSFVTLTYANNMQDINKAKHDIAIFFKRLKRWWNNPKRIKYLGVNLNICMFMNIKNEVLYIFIFYLIEKYIKVCYHNDDHLVLMM